MNTVQLRLYDLLRKELLLSDDKAAAFVVAVEEVIEQKEKISSQPNATKEDIYNLKINIKEDIHKLEIKLEQSKSDMYKAMFLSGVIQLIAILGGVLAIVKFMMK